MALTKEQTTLLSLKVETSMIVLAKMTQAQQEALQDLTQRSMWTKASITLETGWDLPEGWLYVVLGGDGMPDYTLGISPEGSVHS